MIIKFISIWLASGLISYFFRYAGMKRDEKIIKYVYNVDFSTTKEYVVEFIHCCILGPVSLPGSLFIFFNRLTDKDL